jgi:hypothetical protein
VPVVIELDRGLIWDIIHFSMDIAIEGLHHFKVVNCAGMKKKMDYFQMEINGAANAVTDTITAQIQRYFYHPLFTHVSALSFDRTAFLKVWVDVLE